LHRTVLLAARQCCLQHGTVATVVPVVKQVLIFALRVLISALRVLIFALRVLVFALVRISVPLGARL